MILAKPIKYRLVRYKRMLDMVWEFCAGIYKRGFVMRCEKVTVKDTYAEDKQNPDRNGHKNKPINSSCYALI